MIPYCRLVSHFLARITGEASPGMLLGLLAAPGAFQSLLMLDKYSTFLNWMRGALMRDVLVTSAPDKYMFLAIAMAVTGIVTVLKWDRILPDAQDYLNLAPLPIRPRTVLLANAAAIAIVAAAIAVTVSGVSAVLFPLFVVAAMPVVTFGYAPFMAAHAVSVLLASLFAFCAVFVILGSAAAVLRSHTWVKGALLVAFAVLLASGFAGTALIRHPVPLLPSMWYLALYQSLQHRATPEMARMAPLAFQGLAGAAALAMIVFGFSYRRRYASTLEDRAPQVTKGTARPVLALLDAFAWGTAGFDRAVFRFAVRAILRNETQRLCLAVPVGLGWLLALQSPGIEGPLMAAYLLILGLRLAFEFPADVPANWIFRTAIDSKEHETLAIGRRILLAFVTPLVLAPWLAILWRREGLPLAALHTAIVLALCLVLSEILLTGYRKIPLTCSIPGFREDLPMMCLLLFLGFVAFASIGAAMDRWIVEQPLLFVLVPAAMAGAWWWNQRRLESALEAGELETGVSFESSFRPTVERLNL